MKFYANMGYRALALKALDQRLASVAAPPAVQAVSGAGASSHQDNEVGTSSAKRSNEKLPDVSDNSAQSEIAATSRGEDGIQANNSLR